jgi:indolepyruvate ferredoxin oxidoreductase beta subunit
MTVTIGAAEYPENVVEQLRKEHTVYAINGDEVALGLGNSKVLNSVVLGLAAKYMEFSKEAWLSELEKTVPPKTIQLNTKAFLLGYESAQ